MGLYCWRCVATSSPRKYSRICSSSDKLVLPSKYLSNNFSISTNSIVVFFYQFFPYCLSGPGQGHPHCGWLHVQKFADLFKFVLFHIPQLQDHFLLLWEVFHDPLHPSYTVLSLQLAL